MQIDGNIEDVNSPKPIDKKFEAFGWAVFEIDGHDFDQIEDAVKKAKQVKGKPSVIIAKTVKGKGVSFMENVADWHGKAAAGEQDVYKRQILNLPAKMLRDVWSTF